MYLPNLKLYHCNTKINIELAISDNNYLILKSTNDRYWIGDGIYFWDNLSNAKYWKSEKERKNSDNLKKIEFSIASAIVKLDKLLDLTDSDVLRALEEVFNQFYIINPTFKKLYFGEKINFYFEEYPDIQNKYEVIKANGNYPKLITNLFPYNPKKLGITSNVRTIYNVINLNAIVELKEEVS